jgi:tetratricopeptide (TPR) repeat protein
MGAKGNGFDKLEQRLRQITVEPLESRTTATETPPPQQNILDSLKLDQALKLAKKKVKEGSPEEAKRIYKDILNNFPQNKRAGDGLKVLASRRVSKASKAQDPPQDQLQPLINLYTGGELQKALDGVDQLLQQFPYSITLLNIQGASNAGLGNLEEAIEAYKTTLAIKPDYAEAYYNMGLALKNHGKLEEAIEAYNKALAIKPDYAEAIENSLSLAVQLLPVIANHGYNIGTRETQVNSEILLRPKYQIQNAIKAYLEADFSTAHLHNNNFKACDRKLLDRLNPKDKVFCTAYSTFIGHLLEANWDEKPDTKNKVYHLGESHCLSYAHRNIAIDGSNFRIASRITFGAKAFHFSRTKHDSFKEITKAHIVSLPRNSKVFLTYGEIDCRPNEGFISAATKLDKPLEELIDHTTSGYVQWFLEQNAGQRHHLYFINVPAPVYDEKLTTDLNSEVARTVALFNAALKKYSLQLGFNTVDVFKFTVGKGGFSNSRFHLDNHHLGAKALPEIERQLS